MKYNNKCSQDTLSLIFLISKLYYINYIFMEVVELLM